MECEGRERLEVSATDTVLRCMFSETMFRVRVGCVAVGITVFAMPMLGSVLFGENDVTLWTAKVIAETKVLVEDETSFGDPGKTVIALSEPRGMGVGFDVFGCGGSECCGLDDGQSEGSVGGAVEADGEGFGVGEFDVCCGYGDSFCGVVGYVGPDVHVNFGFPVF